MGKKAFFTLFRLFMAIYIFLYRHTGGKFGSRVQGLRVLLLTTTGRKTGKLRTTPLGYLTYDGGYVVTGSNAGFDTHPAWFHNLKSNASATVEIGDRRFDVSAEIAGSDERGRLWAQLIELAPGYAAYAQRTRREIPMVILRPMKR
jgi:deazaflavin-dependent oxidoreductase (nitroreductase family)